MMKPGHLRSIKRVRAGGVELVVDVLEPDQAPAGVAGEPVRGPVIVLHGFTGSASAMTPLSERLARLYGLRVIAPDLVGHGRSEAPANDHHYSLEAMAEQVWALADSFSLTTFHLVGYSMGGRLALTAACLNPRWLRSLTLVGATAGITEPEARRRRTAADAARAEQVSSDFEAFVDEWMADPLFVGQSRLGAEHVRRARAQRMASSPEGLARSLRRAGTGMMTPLHDRLDGCDVPSLIVAGDHDAKFCALGAELAAGLSRARMIRISEAGHACHLEQPDATAAAIGSFIVSVDAGSRRSRKPPQREELAVSQIIGDIHPFRLALRKPFAVGGMSIRFRSGFLVSLSADGLTGWGEASPLPGWSRTSLLDSEAALRRALAGISASGGVGIGASGGTDIGALIDDLTETPHARAALTGAWADLQAQQAGRTLAAHLAGDSPVVAQTVATCALVTAAEPREVEQAAHQAREAGFNTVKLKVGGADPATDVARIIGARTGVGAAGEVRLDANGAWDVATAVEVLRRVEDCDISHCEEPSAGLEALADVARHSPVPVAADESIRTGNDAVAALNLGVRTLIVKPQALGGPDIAMEILALAHNAGAVAIVTAFLDSAVGVCHALHAAAAADATGPGAVVHGLATSDFLASDVADAPPIEAGAMRLSQTAGLGITPRLVT